MLNFDMRINLRFAVIGQLVAYTPDAVTAQNLISRLQAAIQLSELVQAKYCLNYWCVAKWLNSNICVSVADPLNPSILSSCQMLVNDIFVCLFV